MIGRIGSLLYAPVRAVSDLFAGGKRSFEEVLLSISGWSTTSGESVNVETAMGYSAAYACTRLLSTSGSGLPLNLRQPRQGGGNEQARQHPLFRVLHRKPNHRMSSMAFRLYGFHQQINWGDFYAEISRNQFDQIDGLYPIHHSRVNYEEQGDGSIAYSVSNSMGKPTLLVNDRQPGVPNEMLHIPSIIPRKDGIGGVGVIANARNAIGHGLAADRHGAVVFKNGCRPLLAITHKRKRDLKEDEKNVLRQDWLDWQGGPENMGKPALLGHDMEITPFSWNMKDSQYLETRKFQIEEIARWYGVPPHMIGHLERSTFNNIEMQSLEYVTYSLMPWLKMWEEQLELHLLTEAELDAGLEIKHNVNGLLRGDHKSRGEFYQLLWNLGVLSINEIRALEDMNPIGPEGDKHFVPMNMTTAEKAGTEDASASQAGSSARAASADPEARQAAVGVLSDVLKRMWTKEANAAKRAAKNATTFLEWLDSFYTSHQATLLEALGPYNRLAIPLGLAIVYPSDLASESQQRLEEICGAASAENLAAAVALEVDAWASDRLEELLEPFKEESHAGAM